MKYCGVDVYQMLLHLSEKAESVRLDVVGDKQFRIYVMSDEFGEFEMEGSLFMVVMNAFKPYKTEYLRKNAHLRDRLYDLINGVDL